MDNKKKVKQLNKDRNYWFKQGYEAGIIEGKKLMIRDIRKLLLLDED